MGTVIIIVLLIFATILAVYKIMKDKKAGKSIQCGGDCSACQSNCHSKKE